MSRLLALTGFSVLVAVGIANAATDRDYFTLSKPGAITVLADGGTRFDESDTGTHRNLILDESRRPRALEAMVMLASQPPVSSRRTINPTPNR